MQLNYSLKELEDIKHEQEGDELCWCYLMETWLFDGGSTLYPATWDGLYHLLLDSEAISIAKLLRTAVTRAVWPLPSPPPPPNAKAESPTKDHSEFVHSM